ncbi:hypothetical protein BDR26DRAFT_274239 [Obelidium mucronatum]|nr:hypothetical protein BDR26DRAFT_274239 [Obelidium mucronatum]
MSADFFPGLLSLLAQSCRWWWSVVVVAVKRNISGRIKFQLQKQRMCVKSPPLMWATVFYSKHAFKQIPLTGYLNLFHPFECRVQFPNTIIHDINFKPPQFAVFNHSIDKTECVKDSMTLVNSNDISFSSLKLPVTSVFMHVWHGQTRFASTTLGSLQIKMSR